MATRYVTLKDSNGDTIYPQSVIAQVANGEITTGLLADGAVTSDKIDWSTVDDISWSNFAPNGFIRVWHNSGGDFNTITNSGLYYLTAMTANVPSSGSQIYLAIVLMNGGYGRQIAMDLWNNNTYSRRCENGTWGVWVKFQITSV